jgi:hypothetical protein
MCQEYNGWTNRETWATMLHINNDQWMQKQAAEYARTSLEEHPEGGADSCLAESLENWVTEDLLTHENIVENPFLFSMLTDIGSLYRVNWHEIARAEISDIEVNA